MHFMQQWVFVCQVGVQSNFFQVFLVLGMCNFESLVNLTDNYNKTEFLLAELSCKREWNLNKGICFSMPRENPRLEFDNAALVKFQSSYTFRV